MRIQYLITSIVWFGQFSSWPRMASRAFAGLVLGLGLSGCGETQNERASREAYWGRAEAAQRSIGAMTTEQVKIVREKLAEMKFPARGSTIARMLPATLKPHPRLFDDAMTTNSAGQSGGSVVDYWLNQYTVIRVGTVYYAQGEPREEWYEILSAEQAYAAGVLRSPNGAASITIKEAK